MIINKLKEIYHSKHQHFLSIEYKTYKRWKWAIKIAVLLNKKYIPCEIFRKKYKNYTNFVVIGLKFNGKNVRRRVNGYAKEYIDKNEGTKCIYCSCDLNNDNATSDHIVPISKYGNNCQVNLIVCCTKCNGERGSQDFKTYLKNKNIIYSKIKHPFI